MENNTQQQNDQEINKISAEVLEHMMNPKNYGVMEDNDGIGKAEDSKTGEFAMVYIKLDGDILKDISFGCKACQDTVIAGSLFTEMVKGDTLDNAVKSMMLMEEKISDAPKRQKACSNMVLQAFRASIRNKEARESGKDEEMWIIDLKESCEGVNQ